ncbi:prepilin-type N-terminal cleavage/methylation domain-containing protein [Candidatus Sumerlaeota bacterium]|nr:prepilin-type N-terminal cleavage/methylation domain-containing protein [Candidatus Sumerlaeota bacterium]
MLKKGFTLIELLIVVAIIAILAAIAVPNFLEAQIRSKVSRVKADQRSLATAIESYYVDNNSYPSCDTSWWQATSGFGANNLPGSSPQLLSLVTFRQKQNNVDYLHTLTTPISYVTSLFVDPFASTHGAIYEYSTPSLALSLDAINSGWIVWSFGPDNDEKLLGDVRPASSWGVEQARASESDYNPNGRIPSVSLIAETYDPTNGSTSNGDVYRTKQ